MIKTALPAGVPGRPGADPVRDVTLGLRAVIRAGEKFRNSCARARHLGPSDVIALEYLRDHGPSLPREIAAHLGVRSGSVTTLLDRIEKAGFLRRANNPQDRRSLLIQLTPAGEEAMQWLCEQFNTAVGQALSLLPATAASELPAVLKLLSHTLEEDHDLHHPKQFAVRSKRRADDGCGWHRRKPVNPAPAGL